MTTPNTFPGLDAITIAHGAHERRGNHLCAMESVAWLAGESHSDHPDCTCPVIASVVRRLNDARGMTDELRRELLVPLIPKLLGTRASDAVMVRRAFLAVDFAVREGAPAALDTGGFGDHAARLRALPEIIDRDSARAAQVVAQVAAQVAAHVAAHAAAADVAAADDAAYAYPAYAAAYADAAAADARLRIFRGVASLIGRMCDVSADTSAGAEG
jgi:hypothetical protein